MLILDWTATTDGGEGMLVKHIYCRVVKGPAVAVSANLTKSPGGEWAEFRLRPKAKCRIAARSEFVVETRCKFSNMANMDRCPQH